MIYALVDPASMFCRYVGKTKGCVRARLKAHISDARRHPRIPRFRWINKLAKGGLHPSVIELEETDDAGWQEAEQFWIAYMRSIGSPLLNATSGGDGLHGFSHTEETKRKMSIAGFRTSADPVIRAARGDAVRRAFTNPDARLRLSNSLRISHARESVREKLRKCAKAKAATPEFRAWVSKAQTGKIMSLETRAKLSLCRKGVPRSPEAIKRVADGHRGLKHSEETKAKMRATWLSKKIERLALEASRG